MWRIMRMYSDILSEILSDIHSDILSWLTCCNIDGCFIWCLTGACRCLQLARFASGFAEQEPPGRESHHHWCGHLGTVFWWSCYWCYWGPFGNWWVNRHLFKSPFFVGWWPLVVLYLRGTLMKFYYDELILAAEYPRSGSYLWNPGTLLQ